MMRLPLCVAVASTILVGGTAPAGPINWLYSTTISTPGQGPPIEPAHDSEGNIYPISGSDLSYLRFLPTPTATGSAQVVLSHVVGGYSSNPGTQDPEGSLFGIIQPRNAIAITLQLVDVASHAIGSLIFNGHFVVGLGDQKNRTDIAFAGPAAQSVTLGGNSYTVGLNLFDKSGYTETVFPGGPGFSSNTAATVGDITARVDVANTPEPATLTLAGLGLVGVVAARWRRAAQH